MEAPERQAALLVTFSVSGLALCPVLSVTVFSLSALVLTMKAEELPAEEAVAEKEETVEDGKGAAGEGEERFPLPQVPATDLPQVTEPSELPVLPMAPVAERLEQLEAEQKLQELQKEVEGDEVNLLPEVEKNGEGTGVLEGLIFDAKTSVGLPGASVSLPTLRLVTRTDEQGRYRFAEVPAGAYELSALKSGYDFNNQKVQVAASKTSTVDFGLTERAIETDDSAYVIEEYDFIEEFEEEKVFTLDLEGEKLPSLVAGISKAEFTAAGVSDAAGAVSKVAGANIVGGQFAVVRGLGDRYSNTTFNGALIPSADPSRKAVQLDLFPSDLLQSVNIFKTARPDLTAEFTGGLVEIETLKIPEERLFGIKFGAKTDSVFDDRPEFRNLRTGRFNFKGEVENPFARFYGEAALDLARDRTGELAESFRNDLFLTSERASPNELGQDFSVTFADNFDFGSFGKVGVVGTFTREERDGYRRRFRSRSSSAGVPFTAAQVAGFLPGRFQETFRDGDEVRGLANSLAANEDLYSHSVDLGGLANFGWELDENNTLNFSYFFNRSSENQVAISRDRLDAGQNAINRIDVLNGNAVLDGLDYTLYSESLEQTQRDLEIKQVGGAHQLTLFDQDLEFDWLYSRTKATEVRPNSFTLLLRNFPALKDTPSGALSTYTGDRNPQSPSINSTSTEEVADFWKADLSVPLIRDQLMDEEEPPVLAFGAGVSSYSRKRTVEGVQLTPSLRSPFTDPETGERTRSNSPEGGTAGGRDFIENGGQNIINRFAVSSLSGTVTYNALGSTDQSAFYLMLSGASGDWDYYGGVRREVEDRSYTVDVPGNPRAIRALDSATGVQEEEGYFPSLSLGKKFGWDDEHRVQLAWSKTIARPTFYEFAPIDNFDPISGETRLGNVALRDALASNFDLAWTWTPEADHRLNVGLFFKEITDPIVQVRAFDSNRLTFQNFPRASVRGLEVEWYRKWMNFFSITANGSYVNASLDPLVFQSSLGNDVTFEIDSLPGQAEYLANLIMAYDNPDTGWNASLVYNFTDSFTRLALDQSTSSPGRNPRPGNVVSKPRQTLDFVLGKTFSLFDESDAKLSFRARNLFEAPIEFVYEGSTLAPFEKYNPGRDYSISFSAKF